MLEKVSPAILALCLCGPCCGTSTAQAQQAAGDGTAPVIVQPGSPGQPTRTLTATTAVAEVRPPSEADVRFMQDMIMHHNQAVEMTELLKTRSHNPEVREIGAKIDLSQTDEMRYMKQWLNDRGIPVDTGMDGMTGMAGMAGMDHAQIDHSQMDQSQMAGMDHSQMAGMDHSQMAGMDHSAMPDMDHGPAAATTPKVDPRDVAMMVGMLTPRQMDTLRASTGERFDYLFLTGMMQHHGGALLMVKQLFANPGAGQDPLLFDFANDVDNTQQAEIDIMKHMLRKVQP